MSRHSARSSATWREGLRSPSSTFLMVEGEQPTQLARSCWRMSRALRSWLTHIPKDRDLAVLMVGEIVHYFVSWGAPPNPLIWGAAPSQWAGKAPHPRPLSLGERGRIRMSFGGHPQTPGREPPAPLVSLWVAPMVARGAVLWSKLCPRFGVGGFHRGTVS